MVKVKRLVKKQLKMLLKNPQRYRVNNMPFSESAGSMAMEETSFGRFCASLKSVKS
jgi:hypothetical protein